MSIHPVRQAGSTILIVNMKNNINRKMNLKKEVFKTNIFANTDKQKHKEKDIVT